MLNMNLDQLKVDRFLQHTKFEFLHYNMSLLDMSNKHLHLHLNT